MSEPLLIAPEALQGLHVVLGGLEGLRNLFVEQSRALIPVVLNLAESSRTQWLQCIRVVAAGKTHQVHPLRDEMLAALQGRLQDLQQALRLARMAAVLAGEELPGSERLPQAIQDLERLHREVFSRWQTEEDLESLAVQHYPLFQDRLVQIAKRCPPPSEWYAEDEERPF